MKRAPEWDRNEMASELLFDLVILTVLLFHYYTLVNLISKFNTYS